jgi:hypothetical protein
MGDESMEFAEPGMGNGMNMSCVLKGPFGETHRGALFNCSIPFNNYKKKFPHKRELFILWCPWQDISLLLFDKLTVLSKNPRFSAPLDELVTALLQLKNRCFSDPFPVRFFCLKTKILPEGEYYFCVLGRNRTYDLSDRNRTLYPLSYKDMFLKTKIFTHAGKDFIKYAGISLLCQPYLDRVALLEHAGARSVGSGQIHQLGK